MTRRERPIGPTLYDVAVRQASVRRRVQDLQSRVVTLRADVAVLNEQIEVLDEEVDSLRVRAMVSETPLAIKEHAEASRHAELAHKARDLATQQIHVLEVERDELLDDISLEVG
jgi:chromosome segregation ATPase